MNIIKNKQGKGAIASIITTFIGIVIALIIFERLGFHISLFDIVERGFDEVQAFLN